ncbi:MAG: hypothetical protein IPM24_17645 [Bryobacterales bacterium]|nr:hypothetical protein [Bryobacterales bacterium]
MIGAILRAQWQTLRNLRFGQGRGAAIFSLLTSALWYGLWVTLALGAFVFTAGTDNVRLAELVYPRGLMFVMLYWQVSPLLVASLGASLDLKKLLVYPVEPARLFWVEVLLRLSTGIEMLIVLTGSVAGIFANPHFGGWSRLPVLLAGAVLFIVFNLTLAAGMRSLLERILAHKRLREVFVLFMILTVAAPQLLLVLHVPPEALERFFVSEPSRWWPWAAAASILLRGADPIAWLLLAAWTLAGYGFGRWQFQRNLRFDAQAAGSAASERSLFRGGVFDKLYRLPGVLLPDPLGALVEKEVRMLARSPRFRLVFIMGFTFGLLVWLPVVLRRGQGGVMSEHFLTIVSVYALTLLGQVSYWNAFGFDRSATQFYFAAPVRLWQVIVAKNIAAGLYIAAEVMAVAAASFALRLRFRPELLVEALTVTLVFGSFLIAAGNLTSVHLPRALNPERSAQGGGGSRSQALVLLVIPLAAFPVGLAFLGRYAFQSEWVFYGLLAFAGALGAMVYWLSMESATRALMEKREWLIGELARSDGPVASD